MFETQRSLQKLADLIADAARQDAELVVFPEVVAVPKYGEECVLVADLDEPNSSGQSSTSTWWATIPEPTCFGLKSTSSR
jgi:predicted amidohydrolase